jgi:hypothetical protein
MTVNGHLERFRSIATALDSRYRIPGVGVRVGYDAILGLIPGIGDILSGAIASYGLVAGFRLGAPPSVLLRMLGNIALDTIIGAIPLLGDLFDIGWKGNLRNLALLDRWAADPHRVARRSAVMITALAGGVLAVLMGTSYLVFRLLAALLSLG